MKIPKKTTSQLKAFQLHTKYSVHLMISFTINTLIAAAVIGFSHGLKFPFLRFDVLAFLIAIVFLTLLENMIKIILYRFLFKYMLLSFGLISFIILLIIFYLLDILLGQTFEFLGMDALMLFILSFQVLRYITTILYQRYRWHKTLSRRS